MKRVEVDFKDNNKGSFFAEVNNGLMNEGGVLIRNAIPQSKIEFYKASVENVTEKLKQELSEAGISFADCNQKYTLEDQKKDKRVYLKDVGFRLGQGMVSLQMFQRFFPQFSYHDLISDIHFFKICSQIFNNEFSWFEKSQVRSVSTNASQKTGFAPPIHFHFDAQYHRPPHSNICFWTALTPCGEDAPSLQVLLEKHQEVQRISKFDFTTREMDQSVISEINEDVSKHFDLANIWKPIFGSGDIFLFSTWTLHASHSTNSMNKDRLSAEIRVIGNHPDQPFFT